MTYFGFRLYMPYYNNVQKGFFFLFRPFNIIVVLNTVTRLTAVTDRPAEKRLGQIDYCDPSNMSICTPRAEQIANDKLQLPL